MFFSMPFGLPPDGIFPTKMVELRHKGSVWNCENSQLKRKRHAPMEEAKTVKGKSDGNGGKTRSEQAGDGELLMESAGVVC